jgi:hypothetical protein
LVVSDITATVALPKLATYTSPVAGSKAEAKGALPVAPTVTVATTALVVSDITESV